MMEERAARAVERVASSMTEEWDVIESYIAYCVVKVRDQIENGPEGEVWGKRGEAKGLRRLFNLRRQAKAMLEGGNFSSEDREIVGEADYIADMHDE